MPSFFPQQQLQHDVCHPSSQQQQLQHDVCLPSSQQQQLQHDDEMELLPAKRNNVENEQLTLISDYKVIHSSILQQIVESVSKCKHCNRENSAQVFQENSKKKRGM